MTTTETKGIPERINIAEIVREKDKGFLKFALLSLFIVPAVLYGIGRLIATQTGQVPTFLWVIIVLCVLFSLACIAGAIKNRREPEKDSRFRWPEIGSRDEVIHAIEEEWNGSPADQKERFGDYYITPSWLIDMSEFRPRPLRYAVWIYYSSKSNYVNGVPTGTTRRVLIRHSGVGSMAPWAIPVDSEDEGTELLFTLRRRAPWAFFGYSEPYFRGWKNDQEGISAAAKARYVATQTGQPIEQSSEEMPPELSGA